MNLSIAIALVQEGIRPVRVEYDPDIARNNNPNKLFKTLDSTLAKDDLVIVPTSTRHGFTIAKVVEIDFAIDYSSSETWGWIGGKFDKTGYDHVLKVEDGVKHKIAKMQEAKMRQEMIAAAGIDSSGFAELQSLLAPAPAKPSPLGQAPRQESPEPPPYSPADYGKFPPTAAPSNPGDEISF